MNMLNTLLLLHFIIKCQSETLIYILVATLMVNFRFYFQDGIKTIILTVGNHIANQNGFLEVMIVLTIELSFKKHFSSNHIINQDLDFCFGGLIFRNNYRIHNWAGYRFKVYIDNIQKHNQQYYHNQILNNLCGNPSYYYETFQLDLYAYHYSPTVQILISGEQVWGISDIQLFIEKCPIGCHSCNQNGCYNQILYIEYFTARQLNVNINDGWSSGDVGFQDGLVNAGDFQFYRLLHWSQSKKIYLTPHDAVSIQFKIITLNYYHQFEILIDDVLVIDLNTAKQVSLPQVNSYNYYQDLITSQINIHEYMHNLNLITLTIRLKTNQQYVTDYYSYFGIRDIQLFLKTYDNCFDNNIQPFDGCFAKIYDCVIGCSNCVRGECLKCQEGWQYKIQNKNCIPICDDSIINYFEECDDGNTYQYDGCYQCKYSCPLDCSECQFGKCIQCSLKYELINGKCQYICNGYENQEDQENRNCFNRINNLIENGHYQHNLFNNENSKYTLVSSLTCNLQDFGIFGYFYNQCIIPAIQHCKISFINKCLQCEENYQLENNKLKCITICNDGIVIELEQEQCDDLNNIQFDGCYKCQYSCQLECLNCVKNKCYQCFDGWKLIDYSCYQYCGDGQVAVSSIEQCDDGNYDSGDGCFECKYQCIQYCNTCIDKNTCYICEKYYELYNNQCRPICGDEHIVIGLEECEDGNDIPYDGCFNCQFQCEEGCQTCTFGICLECIKGYTNIKDKCEVENYTHNFDEEEQEVSNKCGDAIYTDNEKCDDGNEFDGDGCSSLCLIEPNWFCNNYPRQSSFCSYNTAFKLQYLNQTQQIQYIQLSFTNKVKLNETILNFTNSIHPSIPSIQQDIYIITIIPVIEIDQTILLDVIYIFQIQILESISTKFYLAVEINANLEDQYKNKVNTTQQTINLQLPKILNQNQLQTANKFQALGNWMMIGLASSSFFLILTGNPSQCMEILDTLQFQSYLKYINVDFPLNVLIYFESSEIVTINPVLIKLKITDFFYQLIGDQYVESIGKLSEYQLNADLLVNIYGQFTQIGFLIILYIFIKYFTKFVYTNCFGNKFIYYIRLMNNKIIQIIGIKFYYLNKSICKINDIFNKKGLLQLVHANSWDLIFKVLLYLASNSKLGKREIISTILSIGYLVSLIIIISQNCKRNNHKIILRDLRNKQHDDIILIKKFLFLIVLIIMQSCPLIQCILLTCILFWYLGQIINIDFTTNKLDLFIIIWMEAPVMVFTLSCMIYCSDFQNYLQSDQQILFGFAQIGFLVLALASPLVRCGYQFFCKVKSYYLKNRKKMDPIYLDVKNIFQIVENNNNK